MRYYPAILCIARTTFASKTNKQTVWVAQAMHDLAGVVRPSDPARSCSLYREALDLFEHTKGKNHFLTAPTLAKLGSLLGDSLVAAAAIPPAPAAPAGPGAAGVARAAGLAEAVCAPGEASNEVASAVAAVAKAVGWCDLDASEAEGMIKRAVLIQGRHLGLRHPAVAASMRLMAELYRKQVFVCVIEVDVYSLFMSYCIVLDCIRGSVSQDHKSLQSSDSLVHSQGYESLFILTNPPFFYAMMD